MRFQKLLLLISKIPFSYKTSILMFIITGGMVSIIFLSQVSIYTLKHDFDVLFEKRTKSIIKLEIIKDAYVINIHETLVDLQNGYISLEQSLDVIELGEQIIEKNWDKYLKITFSNQYETSIITKIINKFLEKEKRNAILQNSVVANIDTKHIKIKNFVSKILIELKKENYEEASILLNDVYFEINAISVYLTNLTNYDLEMAVSEKNDTQNVFNTLSMILNMSVVFVFLFSILLSIVIIRHFKDLHFNLEDIVDEKTKALQVLNESLEQKIKVEVTNSRKKDLILLQQAKLASLGEMIANIAHQWRQPLGSIMMIVQGFQTKMELGKLSKEIVDEKVDDAMQLGNSMSKTLQDFQDFFNPNRAKERFCLKQCIEYSFDLSKYILDQEKIEFRLDIDKEIFVYGFYNEFSQVFLNIISNSQDALSSQSEKKLIEVMATSSKNKIRINIVDNGSGIEEDILPHVFEPYYTTKYKSAGTGIGLYMSQQIIQKHMHGTISCKNINYKMHNQNFEHCTLFTITIPINNNQEDT